MLEYLDGWTKIRSGSAEGYVPADTLITGGEAEQHAEEYENNTVTVTASVLNVREGQGTDTPVLTQIELDEQYQATGEPVDGWYPVKVGDIDGWGVRRVCDGGNFLFLWGDERGRREADRRRKGRAGTERTGGRGKRGC